MTDNDNARKSWTVGITGEGGKPAGDKITVTRHNPPQIYLEIAAPSIRSAGSDQKQLARQVIQATVHALQEALDSPSALTGFRP